jgi:hypothetical protein
MDGMKKEKKKEKRKTEQKRRKESKERKQKERKQRKERKERRKEKKERKRKERSGVDKDTLSVYLQPRVEDLFFSRRLDQRVFFQSEIGLLLRELRLQSLKLCSEMGR